MVLIFQTTLKSAKQVVLPQLKYLLKKNTITLSHVNEIVLPKRSIYGMRTFFDNFRPDSLKRTKTSLESSLKVSSDRIQLSRFSQTVEKSLINESNQNNRSNDSADNDPNQPGRMQVAVWLFICAGMVFIMVLIGGITRLTESGLSITEWKPFRGSIPPRSEEEWQSEFEKYKQSPEYIKLNQGMTLEDYKKIYFWEWTHREWGRIIGVVFTLPFAYFVSKGFIRGKLLYQCSALLALGGFQGALGWYMVKSGLDAKNFEENNSAPRVSQYRLAAHLTSAVALYSGLLWISMGLASPQKYTQAFPNKALRGIAFGATHLAYLTAFSGAFVAGLDAGLIYNTFPLMGGSLIPEGLLRMTPWYKNFTENDTTVQFNHRVLGITTVSMTTATYLLSLKHAKNLPKPTRLAFSALFGMGIAQATLGISTLLTFVPVSLAACHQAGAMSLLSISLWLLHELKKFKR